MARSIFIGLGVMAIITQPADAQLVASATWGVATGGNGHHYELHLVAGGLTWTTARDAALAAGGYLATPTTSAENAFVAALADDLQVWTLAANGRSIGPWIGGSQLPGSMEPAGGWTWVTGEPWGYTNWAAGEPNNTCNGIEEHLLCFWNQTVLTSPQTAATWNDYAECVGPVIGYVIEFESTPTVYCTAKVNSQGCTPAIGWSGTPSVSSPDAFLVTAANVLNNKPGLLFYGYSQAALPFQGGFKCVAAPIKRTPIQGSGGNPPPDDCSGSYSYDMNARIQSGIDPMLVAGSSVYCQYWSRDPISPSTTGLTDALCASILP